MYLFELFNVNILDTYVPRKYLFSIFSIDIFDICNCLYVFLGLDVYLLIIIYYLLGVK